MERSKFGVADARTNLSLVSALETPHDEAIDADNEKPLTYDLFLCPPLNQPPLSFVPTIDEVTKVFESRQAELSAKKAAEKTSEKEVNDDLFNDHPYLKQQILSIKLRQNLIRLRQQTLELARPNRHGVALIYGPRMSCDDGYDYRVIYWGELIGSTKGETEYHRKRAKDFRALIRSLVEASPDKQLTVEQLVIDLDINMSKGWVHFAKITLPGKPDPYSEFLLRQPRSPGSEV